MTEQEIEKIADEADLIVAGYAYTVRRDRVAVTNLNAPEQWCVLTIDGEVTDVHMDDETLQKVKTLYRKNKQFLFD